MGVGVLAHSLRRKKAKRTVAGRGAGAAAWPRTLKRSVTGRWVEQAKGGFPEGVEKQKNRTPPTLAGAERSASAQRLPVSVVGRLAAVRTRQRSLEAVAALAMALLKGGGGGGPTGVGAEDGRGDGVRPPATVSYAFEKELINRQNRHIRLYDSFLPSLKRVPIAIKFWSKYDSTAAGRASGLPNFDRYCALVEKTIAEGPRDRYPEPITESQW